MAIHRRPPECSYVLSVRELIQEEAITMDTVAKPHFDSAVYLATEGTGRKIVRLKARQILFSQGSSAD